MKLFYDIETIPTALPWEPDPEKEDEFPPIPVHRIVSIGVLMMTDNFGSIELSGPTGTLGDWSAEPQERPILEGFTRAMESKPTPAIVDWNGRGFDMPVIQARCFHYGIPIPWYFEKLPDNRGGISQWSKEYRDRYGGKQIDVADKWTNAGASRKPHLAELAALMGLPGKTDMDGGQVYDAYKAGRFEDIHRYCMQDVYQTAMVTFRYLYTAGRMGLEGYQGACRLVLDDAREAGIHGDFLSKIDMDALLLGAKEVV